MIRASKAAWGKGAYTGEYRHVGGHVASDTAILGDM